MCVCFPHKLQQMHTCDFGASIQASLRGSKGGMSAAGLCKGREQFDECLYCKREVQGETRWRSCENTSERVTVSFPLVLWCFFLPTEAPVEIGYLSLLFKFSTLCHFFFCHILFSTLFAVKESSSPVLLPFETKK